MPELTQIAAQIAFGPIQVMMMEPEMQARALGLMPLVALRRSGWMALPLQVVVLGRATG